MTRIARRTPRILVVDDDPGLLRLLTIRLRSEKYEVEPVESGVRALEAVSRFRPDLVVTDLRMAGLDGIELLKELRRRWPGLNVILLTAHGTIPDAVRATQSGAVAFLTKPVDKERLLEEVRRALRTSGIAQSQEDWREEFATRSPLMEERLARAHAVAGTDVNVLITGEPGTGKGLLARAIHRASERAHRPLISLDCGQLPPDSGESELVSALQRAGGGTLVAHEADELPTSLQSRLVEFVDELPPDNDVRLIATTDRRPDELTQDGPIARELMHRLAGAQIDMPSLARRREDIPLLVAQCLDESSASLRGTRKSCSPDAIERLASTSWPGNVRQLRSVVRQVAATSTGPVITAELVDEALGRIVRPPSFDEAREEFTRSYLAQLLQLTEGNVSQAARIARRNRTDFYKLLNRYDLRPVDFKG